MYKRVKVYICNECRKMAYPREVLSSMESYTVLPEGWTTLGRNFHVCRECLIKICEEKK